MLTCTGFAAASPTSPMAPLTFNRRDVGKDDVKIEILFCGVCHSDLHFARDEWHFTVYPAVPGHEIVGRVEQIGANVTNFKIGDQVGVGCIVDSCRTCAACQEGLQQYCETGMTGTYGGTEPVIGGPTFGGYSDSIVVDKSYVLRIPAGMDPRRRRASALRWHHPVLSAPPLGRGAGQESRHYRPWRSRPYGRQTLSRYGRPHCAVHHFALEGRGR